MKYFRDTHHDENDSAYGESTKSSSSLSSPLVTPVTPVAPTTTCSEGDGQHHADQTSPRSDTLNGKSSGEKHVSILNAEYALQAL